MSNTDHLELFKNASAQWLCDPYSVEVRFIARKENNLNKLLSCIVNFWPIATSPSSSQRVNTNEIVAGRELLSDISIDKLNIFLNDLEQGKLNLPDISLSLEGDEPLHYYSEMISDRWFCDAHLIISGASHTPISNVDLAKTNSELRLAELPFDGLSDLISHFNLDDTLTNYKQSQIEIRISPPIDMRVSESSLSKGKFTLLIHAHPKLNKDNISLAIRELPEHISSRKQLVSQVKWTRKKNGIQVGKLQITTKNSFAVQAILMAGSTTVRRQYFDDVLKLPNRRLSVLSSFDKDLKLLKRGLNGDLDSNGFEIAFGSLAYLIGFSGCIMNETDAPDIVLSSPNENIVLVECTTRIKDFSSKLGKLVDRKNALIAELKNAGDSRKVYSYLVCSLPQQQIAYDEKELAKHKVMLLTKESIESLLDRLKFPQDLEKMLDSDERQLDAVIAQNPIPQSNTVN